MRPHDPTRRGGFLDRINGICRIEFTIQEVTPVIQTCVDIVFTMPYFAIMIVFKWNTSEGKMAKKQRETILDEDDGTESG